MRIMANIFVYRNIVVDGMVELNENGSKEEKMSNIIKDSGLMWQEGLLLYLIRLIKT